MEVGLGPASMTGISSRFELYLVSNSMTSTFAIHAYIIFVARSIWRNKLIYRNGPIKGRASFIIRCFRSNTGVLNSEYRLSVPVLTAVCGLVLSYLKLTYDGKDCVFVDWSPEFH